MNLIKKHTPIFLRKITPLDRGEFCKSPLTRLDKCHSNESGNPVEIKYFGFPIKLGTRKPDIVKDLYSTYYDIIGNLVNMITHPEKWIMGKAR